MDPLPPNEYEIFADTFYFLALLNPSDAAHERARAATLQQRSKLVTTGWVLSELGNALRRGGARDAFLGTLTALRADSTVILVPPEQRWFDAGVELYKSRPDKEWSLTDCISFSVMRERGISAALTGDHHFRQAGFQVLLR